LRLRRARIAASNQRTPFTQASTGITIPTTDKPRIIVLGSGWGAISFVKAFKKAVASDYDIVLISPRNYFLYTPLLPAVATGTMEERSIVEPIRNTITGKGRYFEAVCQDVDPDRKILTACFPKDAGFPEACFRMQYDHLIVSVGSVNNTFGISGVREHCFFFKGVRDAVKLRRQISECFERAALPYTPDEARFFVAVLWSQWLAEAAEAVWGVWERGTGTCAGLPKDAAVASGFWMHMAALFAMHSTAGRMPCCEE
jgi:Pyridine nucleotide-disulphide oxidoreductase